MRYRVKFWRDHRGLTGQDLADMTGLSPGYISLLENHKRLPSSKALEALSVALGVKAADLIDEAQSEDGAMAAEILANFPDLSREDQQRTRDFVRALKLSAKPG